MIQYNKYESVVKKWQEESGTISELLVQLKNAECGPQNAVIVLRDMLNCTLKEAIKLVEDAKVWLSDK